MQGGLHCAERLSLCACKIFSVESMNTGRLYFSCRLLHSTSLLQAMFDPPSCALKFMLF